MEIVIGYIIATVIVFILGFYNVFSKKVSGTFLFNPFDIITGQTGVELHRDQDSMELYGDQEGDKNKKLE